MTLPSIDEWLNLKDWQFELHTEEGECGKHHWLFSPQLTSINVLEAVELPAEFSLLATQYDGATASYMYSMLPDWMPCANACLSPVVTKLPNVYDGADYALMIIDKQKNRTELEPALIGFRDHYCAPESDKNFDNFSKAIEQIDPYLYLSYGSGKRGDGVFLLTRDKSVMQKFLKSETVSSLAETTRKQLSKHRQLLWRALGPEIGPEECIEKGCDRLRTPVSKRCFLHLNP